MQLKVDCRNLDTEKSSPEEKLAVAVMEADTVDSATAGTLTLKLVPTVTEAPEVWVKRAVSVTVSRTANCDDWLAEPRLFFIV